MSIKHIDVEGMHCAACVSSVEKALAGIPGISSATVSLLKNSATIEFAEQTVSEDDIRSAVTSAGYSVESIYEEGSGQATVRNRQLLSARQYKTNILIAAPLAFVIMAISMTAMMIDVGQESALSINLILLALSLPVLWAGRSFFGGAWRATIHGHATMDTLVAIGSGSAFVYSLVSTLAPELLPHTSVHVGAYYDTASTIIALILVGKWLEARAKGKTADALESLLELRPPTALVLRNGAELTVEATELVVGDVVIVRPGERIPTDALVIQGASHVDESMMTGESQAVGKEVNSMVIGGTLNSTGVLHMRATAVGSDTVLAAIVRAVERAQESKAPLQRFADKISSVFVPIVVAIAICTFIAWMVFGPADNTFSFAMNAAIAVLIIACPCALGLATPTAIAVGSGSAARSGVLFATAESLEILNDCTDIVLDKTGTITEGNPSVQDSIQANNWRPSITDSEVWAIVAAAEGHSEHPVARAIATHATERATPATPIITNVMAVPGRGLTALAGTHKLRLGSIDLMTEALLIVPPELVEAERNYAERALTTSFVAVDGAVVFAIGISDTIRATSKDAVRTLQQSGRTVHMATGDSKTVAEAIAIQVGITSVHSNSQPLDKQRLVRRMMRAGKNVAMVGDGINDAPALAEATVGISLGGGTDVAKSTADVTLVRDDLRSLVKAIEISAATVKNIKQNLFFAFVYNVLGIPLAAGMFYFWTGQLLSPMVAAAAMALSSVTVVSNALRLKSIT